MDSPEYKALASCHAKLVTCIKQSPIDVKTQLVPYRILAPSDETFLDNSSNDNDKKATRIVSAVTTQVESGNIRSFSFLIKALRAAGEWTRTVTDDLEKTKDLESLTSSTDSESRSTKTSPLTHPDPDASAMPITSRVKTPEEPPTSEIKRTHCEFACWNCHLVLI